jgi:hypothetical protein
VGGPGPDPTDEVTADKDDVPIDGDDNHSQSDEEDVTKTPEKGYVHKPLSMVMTADKEPMTPVESQEVVREIIMKQNMKKQTKAPIKVPNNQADQVQCVQPIWTRKLDEIELCV